LYVPPPGSRTHRGIEFCRPLRGLTSFVCASPPVRGLTGGYGSVARCAGSRRLYVPLPRFADSPGDRVLSPPAGAHVLCMCLSPGSRTHRGLRFCRPLRGLTSFVCASPPVRGLTGGYVVSPAARADVVCMCLYPRYEDSPGETVLPPAARAHVVCMC